MILSPKEKKNSEKLGKTLGYIDIYSQLGRLVHKEQS